MKKIKKISFLLMVSVLFFANCEDEIETSKMTLDQSKEATVKVNVYAELDRNNYGMESAPEGTEIRVSIDYDQFNNQANRGVWESIETVNSEGFIELSVPTTDGGVNVELTGAEFEYQQAQHEFAYAEELTVLYNHDGTIKNADGTSAGSKINIKPEESDNYRINYNSSVIDDEYVEAKLELNATTDVEDGSDYVPQNTPITFYIDSEWIHEQQVDVDGRMDVILPKDETVRARFEYNKQIDPDETVTETESYVYDTSVGNFNDFPETIIPVDFGGGDPVE